MNYDDSDRLKPCPFCGSDAEFGSIGDGPDVGGHFVQCLNPVCSASSDLIYPLVNDVKNLLLERWNRRAMIAASPPAPAVADDASGCVACVTCGQPVPAVAEPLTQSELIDGFCNMPHETQYVVVFQNGARFAEAHHGIGIKGAP